MNTRDDFYFLIFSINFFFFEKKKITIKMEHNQRILDLVLFNKKKMKTTYIYTCTPSFALIEVFLQFTPI